MKIILNNETKRVQNVKDLNQLVAFTIKAFKIDMMFELGENFKFYYLDSDGDIISVTN